MGKAGSACILQCMPSNPFQIWFPTPPHGPPQSPHNGGQGAANRVRIRTAVGHPLPGLLQAFWEATLGSPACLPRRVPPHHKLRFAHQDLHPPHHLHNMTWHEDTLHAMNRTLEANPALFIFHIHAIVHSHMHMRLACGLLHAIHAYAHP